MDPRKADCHGHYLYGTGYFSQETKHLSGYSFCNDCRVQESCQEAHRARTQALRPGDVERFESEKRVAARRGIGGHLFAAIKMKTSDPDPYMGLAIENYKKGAAARRLDDVGA